MVDQNGKPVIIIFTCVQKNTKSISNNRQIHAAFNDQRMCKSGDNATRWAKKSILGSGPEQRDKNRWDLTRKLSWNWNWFQQNAPVFGMLVNLGFLVLIPDVCDRN